MKAQPYSYVVTYKTKTVEKRVEAATMFDVNTTIMRCLVKNLAMFGLGLYIYAGEDLPQEEKEKAASDRLKAALKQCEAAKTKEDLKIVWNTFADLQTDNDFTLAMSTKKKEVV